MNRSPTSLPRFFRVRQTFPRVRVNDLQRELVEQMRRMCPDTARLAGKTVAVAVGSRGIASLDKITGAVIAWLKQHSALPFIVPSMGSHGGATAEGQAAVLERFGITAQSMACPIRSDMSVVELSQAAQGFPVYFDQQAASADCVLLINRIKPHTRFAGDIESGLMKMMLIGLGKKRGAEIYHQAIVQHSFDTIVRSVAAEVIQQCNVLGGLAILENAYEETAQLVGVAAGEIERREPELLRQVKLWMPKLPFEQAELLIVDRIGKDISGTGMDTNIIGRKRYDHAALDGDSPNIHHIYVRGLTPATHGNASGIGLAELCHQNVVNEIDLEATRTNCITAGHITGAMLPVDFPNDKAAFHVGCQLAGLIPPEDVSAMWIRDTLSLAEVECSEHFYARALSEPTLEILSPPSPLAFDATQNLVPRFEPAEN